MFLWVEGAELLAKPASCFFNLIELLSVKSKNPRNRTVDVYGHICSCQVLTHFLIGTLFSDVTCHPSAFQGGRFRPGEDEFRASLHPPLSLPTSFTAREVILMLMVSSFLLWDGACGVTLAYVLPALHLIF